MRGFSLVHVEVNCWLPEDADFAAVARRWMEGGVARFPELFARLESGAASAAFVDQPRGGRMAQRKYSASGWQERLAGLPGRPLGLTLSVVDDSDDPIGAVEITVVDEHAGRPGQVRLTINTRTLDQLDADCGRRWMAFLAEAVGSRSVDYGQVTLDGNINHSTSLDMALGRTFIDSIEESREFLRGYAWITLCPAVLAERLGGVAALKASEAFVDVQELPSGDVLLQATATAKEFDDEALCLVWIALAPVIKPGRPETQVGYERNEVILEDAAGGSVRQVGRAEPPEGA